MQSVKIGKLLRQLAVLISRNFQLIWNQKLTLGSLILQAPLEWGGHSGCHVVDYGAAEL